jgi:endonuclease III
VVQAIVRILNELEAHGSTGPAIPTTDPFELILWENVAYLASPERRAAAFDLLKRDVGTAPRAILGAPRAVLERVTAHGILKETFADKLRACAQIAIERFGGDLRPALQGPLKKAKQALRLFPGIGEPGAEKILLLSGIHPFLAPDSNALRVLARVGLIAEDASYARLYRSARDVEQSLGSDFAVLRRAHGLLQRHGQTLCKLKTPACAACPLAGDCAYHSRGGASATDGDHLPLE